MEALIVTIIGCTLLAIVCIGGARAVKILGLVALVAIVLIFRK